MNGILDEYLDLVEVRMRICIDLVDYDRKRTTTCCMDLQHPKERSLDENGFPLRRRGE